MDMDARNLADLYKLPLLDWDRITARLEHGFPQAPGGGGPDRHTYWLATINADGSPHVNGIGALWVDGAFWFETGETSRKGKNQKAPSTHSAPMPLTCGDPSALMVASQ